MSSQPFDSYVERGTTLCNENESLFLSASNSKDAVSKHSQELLSILRYSVPVECQRPQCLPIEGIVYRHLQLSTCPTIARSLRGTTIVQSLKASASGMATLLPEMDNQRCFSDVLCRCNVQEVFFLSPAGQIVLACACLKDATRKSTILTTIPGSLPVVPRLMLDVFHPQVWPKVNGNPYDAVSLQPVESESHDCIQTLDSEGYGDSVYESWVEDEWLSRSVLEMTAYDENGTAMATKILEAGIVPEDNVSRTCRSGDKVTRISRNLMLTPISSHTKRKHILKSALFSRKHTAHGVRESRCFLPTFSGKPMSLLERIALQAVSSPSQT